MALHRLVASEEDGKDNQHRHRADVNKDLDQSDKFRA